MTVFVDTSVWSLALRRDRPEPTPEVEFLADRLQQGQPVVTTGLVLQELLQGFHGARAREVILERFASLPMLVPDRAAHVDAADLRSSCRRRGIQVGTIDALLAALCTRHDLTMLTNDGDFDRMAEITPLRVWRP